MTNKIEIPLSKNKLVLLIVGSIVFIVLAIWLFISADLFKEHSMK